MLMSSISGYGLGSLSGFSMYRFTIIYKQAVGIRGEAAVPPAPIRSRYSNRAVTYSNGFSFCNYSYT